MSIKTHQLARELQILVSSSSDPGNKMPAIESEVVAAIEVLASALVQGPNIAIADVTINKRSEDVAVGLRVLSSLSRYTKQQWLALVQDYGMDIDHNPRDSARDVLGKVLRYLEAHPEVVRVLGTKTRRKKVDTTELENALTKLLERKDV